MNKSKWILVSFLLCLIPLIRFLMSKWGWQIHGEVSFWLLFLGLALVALAVISKQHKKYAVLFAVVFLLLALSTIRKERKDNATSDSETQEDGQSIQITSQQPKEIEITGRETEGKIVFVDELGGAGWYNVEYVGGIIYDTAEDKIQNAAFDIWGTGYDRDWKPYFIYSHVPGVKALEALMIVDGEVGSQDGKVCQFPDGKTTVRIWVEKYVIFFRHEPFKPDVNGNIYCCFQNNYGSWKFRIRKAAD